HGWIMSADIWEYQMAFLINKGFRCIAYDRRGCGRSDDPGNGCDYDTLAADLAALLDQLNLREVTLVGHSAGGGEVARYLSIYGTERVARAVFVASITPFLMKTSDNPEGIDRSYYDDMVAALAHDRPQFIAAGAPGFFGTGNGVSPE